MLLDFAKHRSFSVERWTQTTLWPDLVWVARRYWGRIVLLAFLGAAAGYAYKRWNPEAYISRATVRFIPPQVAERFVTPNVAMQVEQRIFAMTQMLRSRLTATQLIERYGLYPQRRRFYPIADIVPELQDHLRITSTSPENGPEKNTVPSIEICFSYGDPGKAQQVVQRIVELIYEENRRYRSDQSIGTTDFLQQEVKESTEQIRDLESQLAVLPRPGGESQGYEDLLKVEHLNDLERRLTELDHQMNYNQLDRNLRRSAVTALEARLKDILEQGTKRLAPYSTTTDHIRSEVNNLSGRVAELQQRYKPGHADRVEAERSLAQRQQDLKVQEEHENRQMFDREVEDVESQLSRSRAELAGYEATLQRQTAEAAKMREELQSLRTEFAPKEDLEDQRLILLREYAIAKESYANLSKRQKESEMASALERRGQGETAEMVEPPTLPDKPEFPGENIVIGTASMAGAVLGYLLGLLNFLARPRVRIAGHISIFCDAPVLAALPYAENRNSRLLTSIIPGLLLVIGLIAAPGCASKASLRDAAIRSGEAAISKAEYSTAVIYFRKAIQADPKAGAAYWGLGRALNATGQVLPAYEQLVRAGELLPERVEVQEQLADLTYQLYFADPGRPAAALREVEQLALKLRQKWPERASGHRLYAQVLVERRHTAEAAQLMEDVLEHMEDGSIRVQLASVYFQEGERDKAEHHLRQCISANPKFAPAYDLLYLQLVGGGHTPDARAVLEAKVAAIDTLDTTLQLAAHDDATGARDSADSTLTAAAARWSKDKDTYARVGDFWLNRTVWDKAKYWYEAGRNGHPEARSLFSGRLADLMMARKDALGAKALIVKELATSPNDPLLLTYQAAMSLDSNTDGAERRRTQALLESLVSRMPDSPFVHLHLGRAYLLNGDSVKAAEQLQNSVALDPNYAPGWLALAESKLASGDVTQAQYQLDALLKRSPGYLPARLLKAQASLQSQKPAEAEKALQELVQAEPDNGEAIVLLARAKTLLGQGKQASQLLDQARLILPNDPRVVMEQSRLDLASGKAAEALDRLKQAEPAFGQSQEFRAMLASVALMAGDPALAAQRFQSLQQANPSNLQYGLGYASALTLAGRKQEAAQAFENVQKQAGNDSRPWLLYGALMASIGNHKAEKSAYEEALRHDPENPFVLNNLSFLIAKDGGDLNQALTFAERAKRGLPNSWEVSDTLAYIYLRLGLTRNAVATLEQIAQNQTGPTLERTQNVLTQLRHGEIAEVRRQMENNSSSER